MILQLVPQLLVIEQMKSYLCRNLDLRDTFMWLLRQPAAAAAVAVQAVLD